MGSGSQFIDIILFALVAGFLILRLRAVLGRRDGHDSRTPDPFAQPKVERSEDKVVRLPERNGRPEDSGATTTDAEAVGGPLETGLKQIKIADRRFDAQPLQNSKPSQRRRDDREAVDGDPLRKLRANLRGQRLGGCLLYTSDAADE